MKNILILIIFCTTGGISIAFGQQKAKLGMDRELLPENKEEVYIHYNSTFLLAGESLFYKFYNLDPDSGKLKGLSKIGYVELINEKGNRIFLHKLSLLNGSGYGDFLIPSTVPSGTYKLLGYTRWMLNGGKDQYFRGDLVIINPYLEDQNQISKIEDTESQDIMQGKAILAKNVSGSYNLNAAKEVYGKREKVTIRLDKTASGNPKVDFSVSVKKIEDYGIPGRITATSYKSQFRAAEWAAGSPLILPDLRGQLITGKVTGGNSGMGLGDKSLVFSIPGRSFFLRIAKTAPDGTFYFNLDPENYGSQGYFQVLGDLNGEFDITLDDVAPIEKSNLEFNIFEISPSMAEKIRQRSIYNQVENSYAIVKQDSLLSEGFSLPFYGTLPEKYNLDEFTRFPTLQETFVEIIQLSRIRKNREGKSRFELITQGNQGMEPLLIVDGIIVQDHEDLVHFDARKIKSIGLQREQYYLGPEVFQGLIVVETINGDFFTSLDRNFIETVDLHSVFPKKKYFQPQYGNGNNSNSRIPDYRLQLLWQPNVEMDKTSRVIEFFTSDVPGRYEIIVEGFTEEGEAVSLMKIISVQ